MRGTRVVGFLLVVVGIVGVFFLGSVDGTMSVVDFGPGRIGDFYTSNVGLTNALFWLGLVSAAACCYFGVRILGTRNEESGGRRSN